MQHLPGIPETLRLHGVLFHEYIFHDTNIVLTSNVCTKCEK